MKILSIDTAASYCAVAIYDATRDAVLAQISENIGKGHAEVLMDYIERAVSKSAIAMSDIDRVAVNIGPGSFTGVRIGVSAARGFALALNCPAIGITAFEALAFEAQELNPLNPVLVLLEAHRGEIYAANFNADGKILSDPEVLSREEAAALAAKQIDETIFAGSAASAINEALGGRFQVARGEPTASIATYAKLAALKQPGQAPKPLYMRGPDAKPQTGFALPRRTAGD